MLRLACALSATAAVMAVPIATDDASSSAASIPLTTFDVRDTFLTPLPCASCCSCC